MIRLCFLLQTYIAIQPKEVIERLRQVRTLHPESMLGCTHCLKEDLGKVPIARLSWQGYQFSALTSSQPQIKPGQAYLTHLEHRHKTGSSDLRRKDLPIILWSPRGYDAVDILTIYMVRELMGVSLFSIFFALLMFLIPWFLAKLLLIYILFYSAAIEL